MPGQAQRSCVMMSGPPPVPCEPLQSGFLDAFRGESCDCAEVVDDGAPEIVATSDADEETDPQSDAQSGLAILPQDTPPGLAQGDLSIASDEVVSGKASAASASDHQFMERGAFDRFAAIPAAADAAADSAGALPQEGRHDLRSAPDVPSGGRDAPDDLSPPVKDNRAGALPAWGIQPGIAARMPSGPQYSGTSMATKQDRLDASVNAAENVLPQDFALDLGSGVRIFVPGQSLDITRFSVPSPGVADPVPIARQLVQHLELAKDSTIEIVLSPEELGKVRISIGQGDTPMITVLADRPETLDLLRRNVDILAGEMRAAGFSGTDISFGDGGDVAGGKGGFQSKSDKPARVHAPERELIGVLSQVATDRVSSRQLDIRI